MTTKPEWERLAAWLNEGAWHKMTLGDVVSAGIWIRRLGEENAKQAEQIKAVTHLVTQLHQAKGRYHTQLATCALFDAFGLSNTKPEKAK